MKRISLLLSVLLFTGVTIWAQAPVFEFEHFQLENGLTVILVEDQQTPQVSFQLYVDRPIINEAGYAGTGHLMGQLLSAGTLRRTKADIDELVETTGAKLRTDSYGATISGSSEQAEPLMDILADCTRNAIFPADEFAEAVKQNQSALAAQQEDPEAIAASVATYLRYGTNHPYGERMTTKTLSSIPLSACRNFHRRYFRPQISYLIMVGDMDVEAARALAQRHFGSWTSEGKLFREFFDYPQPPPQRQVDFVSRVGAEQSVINITYPIILKPDSKDVIAATVLNQILGGGPNSRLFQNLRGDKGYTSEVYSELEHDPNIGFFNAYASVRHEVTSDAVHEILVEMERLRDEQVSEAELQRARRQLKEAFTQSLKQPAVVAEFALNTLRYNLPQNYYSSYLDNLAKVSRKDIQTMAQKYLLPDRAHVLVVGPKSVVERLKSFAANGRVNYFNPEGRVQEEVKLLGMADITAEQVIDKYVRAIGGQERIMEISDMTTVMEGEVQGSVLTMTQEKKLGGKMHMTVKMSGMTVNETRIKGDQAQILQMGNPEEVDDNALTDLQEQAIIFPEARFRELNYRVEMIGREAIRDQQTYVIKITSPAGKELAEYYDVATHLKLRTVTSSDEATITVDYDDYREVEGLMYPHRVVSSGLMPVPLVFELKSLSVNTGIPDKNFSQE